MAAFDDQEAPPAPVPDKFSSRYGTAHVSEADRAEIKAIEEMAYGFRPATEEEMMLAGQMALTNRAGIAALMRGYLGTDRRGDFASMDMAVRLMTLSLKQLEALNTQRTLRRMRMPTLQTAKSKKTRKR